MAGCKPEALMPLECLVLMTNLVCILAAVGLVKTTVPTIRQCDTRG